MEKEEEPETDTFDAKWKTAARHGTCDSIGGAEYRRVKQEWIEMGAPETISEFIAVRANAVYDQ